TIDNPYFPLPVGRTLVYRGVKDGQSQEDRVTVTDRTKTVAEGITALVVSDVATHDGALLEKTSDWYAQDKQGNVWYLGEDTAHYLPNGKVDTSGSWEAGVNDAERGLVMEADPQIPDAYRHESLAGGARSSARPDTRLRIVASVRHADQLELLVVPLDHTLFDLAHPRDVVLLLRLWLQRTELARHE